MGVFGLAAIAVKTYFLSSLVYFILKPIGCGLPIPDSLTDVAKSRAVFAARCLITPGVFNKEEKWIML